MSFWYHNVTVVITADSINDGTFRKWADGGAKYVNSIMIVNMGCFGGDWVACLMSIQDRSAMCLQNEEEVRFDKPFRGG